MEEIIRKLRIQLPPQGLRERVLGPARAALLRESAEPAWVDRLWEARAFWYSVAATVFVCLVVIFASPANRAVPQATADSPEITPLAKELAEALGDGPSLERRFAAQLAGPAVTTGGNEVTLTELWRTFQ